MKVALTGATGFTGSFTLHALLQRGYPTRCLVRRAETASGIVNKGAEVVIGDLADPAALREAFRGCDMLLNVASMGFGHAPAVVRAAEEAGVRRAVFVSTTAIFTQLNATSKVVRNAAEEVVRNSSLEWTIVRPTMIYGTSADRNICRLIHYIQRYPLLPVFGSGQYLMQPIHVDDLASAIIDAGVTSAAVRKQYNLAGRSPLTYNELVYTVAKLAHRRIRLIHLPHRPAITLLQILERCGLRLPVKAEQIQRLNEHKAFASTEAEKDFGFAPRDFQTGVVAEVFEMSKMRIK